MHDDSPVPRSDIPLSLSFALAHHHLLLEIDGPFVVHKAPFSPPWQSGKVFVGCVCGLAV